ncbi:hypothetical protein REPUB_Repub06bG0056500 [Reevesia pubescens]
MVRKWQLDFRPSKDALKYLAIRLQLPKLHIEHYTNRFFFKIGSFIGKPIKVYVHIGNASKVQYARICVEVHSSQVPPKKFKLEIVFNKSSVKCT